MANASPTSCSSSSLSLLLLLLLLSVLQVQLTTAQNVGSFYNAIYILPGASPPEGYNGCSGMGYDSYCCSSGTCALDESSQIACCANGMICSGSVQWITTSTYNNGQWTPTATTAATAAAAAAGCANACGFYKQLCCSADQYCYTDRNKEAQCGVGAQTVYTTSTMVAGVPQLVTVTEVQTATVQQASVVTQTTAPAETNEVISAGDGQRGTGLLDGSVQSLQVACTLLCLWSTLLRTR